MKNPSSVAFSKRARLFETLARHATCTEHRETLLARAELARCYKWCLIDLFEQRPFAA